MTTQEFQTKLNELNKIHTQNKEALSKASSAYKKSSKEIDKLNAEFVEFTLKNQPGKK